MRVVSVLLAASLVAGAVTATASVPEDRASETVVEASRVLLPCIPVGTYWVGPVPSGEGIAAPDLAVVAIDVRPKDARVHLDDRFVGRARYFDGSPGYLYLEPGRYRLELRYEGYRTVEVALEAEASCRFDLKHRLQRVPGESVEKKRETFGKGKPVSRVFAPTQAQDALPAPAAGRGADLSLRPDLGGADAARPPSSEAALRLRIEPASAAVFIDGGFVATAEQLARMEAPLALAAGRHLVEVRAEGYLPLSREVELSPGAKAELELRLETPVFEAPE